MGKVVVGNFITRLDVPVDRVIEGAIKTGLKSVIIIGYDEDGEEYFASSIADGGTVMFLLERAKFKLLNIVDDLSNDRNPS